VLHKDHSKGGSDEIVTERHARVDVNLIVINNLRKIYATAGSQAPYLRHLLIETAGF
jgi:hypothetical protein